MGNMRELTPQEWELVSGGTISVTGSRRYFDDGIDWRSFAFDDGNGDYHGEDYSKEQGNDGLIVEPETTPQPDIVVNGITATLDAQLHKKADNMTTQILLMGTLLTGGIGAETALFAKLVGTVGKDLATRIAAGGAALGDLALEKSVHKVVYDVLLNNAIKDFQDDGHINSSTLQDWEAYNQFITEYNAYVENLSPDEPEFGDSDWE